MTFIEKHRLIGGRTEKEMLKIAWEGEIGGTGMCEAIAEAHPEFADRATAAATMEWLNANLSEDFAHDAGVTVSLEQAEKLGREGAEQVSKHSFEHLVHLVMTETPVADKMYEELGKHARDPELKDFANNLMVHEPALRDWIKSELDGKGDAERIFAYCERHGISREEAATPRKDRESYGGDKQLLVLAFFPNEEVADGAAMVLRNWDNASEHIKVDGVGVLVKDENGKVKEHKLGKRAGKKGMGIGVALGVVAAIPTGGLSLLGGAAGGVVGGGIVGHFFHKGVKMTDEDAARIGSELDAGHAAVGVLAWDFEADAVAAKLKEAGGTVQSHEVAELPVAART
jgi:uncharacterized membrane protein